jgi:hypothetical protein
VKEQEYRDLRYDSDESDYNSGQHSDTESIDSESLGNAKSSFRSEHMRFMSDISALWNKMAS